MERERKIREPFPVIFRNNLEIVPNIYDLEKVGAGHDGIVFRLGDKVLKVLKYNIEDRKEKGLMTFEKAVFFQDEFDFNRIIQPKDVLLNEDGIYTGYVMDYLEDVTTDKMKDSPVYKQPGDFTCGDLIQSVNDLGEDFNDMTKKKVVAKDLNRGSYIYTADFMHLCDMDKFLMNCYGAEDFNKKALNFAIAKHLYYEMLKTDTFDKQQLRQLSNWIKESSNSRTFIQKLTTEIGHEYTTPIKEYAKEKVKTIIR